MTKEITMEMITIPKSDYVALVAAKEELEDIEAFDRAMKDDSESVPHEYVVRLIDGESPLSVFRDWRGFSQSELARVSGVNRVQIVDIESGRKTGSVATLKKLADALGILIDDLI